MKNKNVIKYAATILLPIVMGIGVVFGVSQPSKTEEVSGYSISELPTTIDLNDTSAANIRSYYSSLNSSASLSSSNPRYASFLFFVKLSQTLSKTSPNDSNCFVSNNLNKNTEISLYFDKM